LSYGSMTGWLPGKYSPFPTIAMTDELCVLSLASYNPGNPSVPKTEAGSSRPTALRRP